MTESRSQFFARLDGSAISTYALVMLVVPLKLWCRISHRGSVRLGWDDIMTILALLSINAFFYVCMAVFSVASRIPILIAFFIVTSWAIAILFLIIFACDPVQASWDLTITNSTCISLHAIYIATSLPNVVTDVLVLILPLPYIYPLHAPTAQRLAITGMFSLGCFVSIVSIIRLTILVRIPLTSADTTYNVKEVIIWSIIELNIGLIGACLPSMRPAVRLLGLDRVVPGLAGEHLGSPAHTSPATPPVQSNQILTDKRRRPRKKGLTGGLFSTLAGLSKWEEEEDGFEMIGDGHEEVRSKADDTDADTTNSGVNSRHNPLRADNSK